MWNFAEKCFFTSLSKNFPSLWRMSCFHEKLAISCFLWQCPQLGFLVLIIHPVGFKDFSVGHMLIPQRWNTQEKIKSPQNSILLKLIIILNCFFIKVFLYSSVMFYFEKIHKQQFIWFTFSNLFCILLRKFMSPWLFYWVKLTGPGCVCTLGVGLNL